ncbi:MAG: 50S ribosomal protein L30 [Sphingobacteriia bacterium]|nr:50S ribosomal protein L30 [Sphingobacteriia bacterium]
MANKKESKALGKIKVTQVGSPIGRKSDQKLTLKGLGLDKLNRSKVLEATPSIMGMVNKVLHLVKVEEV